MNELYHYGVLGMKWGVRRYQNADGSLTPAGELKEQRRVIKNARKEYRRTRRVQSRSGIGIKGLEKYRQNQAATRKAELNLLDARAKYKKIKRGDKAEMRFYRRAMQGSGLRGSYADLVSEHRSTDLYNHLSTKKGKAYADSIEKSVQNHAYAAIIGGSAAILGSTVVSMYLSYKY